MLVKIVVVITAYIFAWNKLQQSTDWTSISSYIKDLSPSSYSIIILIFALMFVNWSLEAIKWKYLIRKTEQISLLKSLAAVWSGVTVGTITPNRIGEFAGRIMFLKPENRKLATTQTLYGDLAQFITTIIFGIIGISLFWGMGLNSNETIFSTISIYLFSGFALIISLLVFFYFNAFIRFISRIQFIKKILQSFSQSEEIKLKEKTVILA
jgi:hypothetical protein